MDRVVGRSAELAEIDRALADARSGRGTLLLICGPAGIGKSRLAETAQAAAQQHGMACARGHAVDDPGAPPLWPWARALRGLGASLPSGEVEDGDAAARFQVFVAVTELLRARAGTAGLLVVLEDLHWADVTSLRLLRHVAAELADLPLAILATFRDPSERPPPDLLDVVAGSDAARTLVLGGLSEADLAAWLPELPDAGVLHAVHEATAGNPLLVRLIAAELSRGVTVDALMTERPQLRRLIAARVARLHDRVRSVVEAASVLGEQIRPDVLASMTNETDIDSALATARGAGVLRDDRFEHALVRDAVYASLSVDHRAVLHRAAAAALERCDVALPGSIASHWQRGDDRIQCLLWAQRADDAARSALGYDDAVRYAALAVDCAQAVLADDAELARLLIRLAEAQLLAGFVEAAAQACAKAAAHAEMANRPVLLAAAALVIQGSGHPIVGRVVLPICRRALAGLPADAHAPRARLTAQLAICLAESDGGRQPADLAAAALAEAELSGDPVAIFDALAARHLTICVAEAVAERLELGRRAVALGAVAGRPIAPLWGHLWRLNAALQLGTIREVDNELAEIDRVARERGSPIARWHHHRYCAAYAGMLGDFAGARAADAHANVLAQRLGDISLMGMSMAFRIHLAITRGDVTEIQDGWEKIIVAAPQLPLVQVSVPIIHALLGDHELARAEFEQFRHVPQTFPVGVRWGGTMTMIGIAAVLVGDAEVAGTIHELLAPTASYFSGDGSGAVYSMGGNGLLLGDLALAAGQADVALTHYRDAVAMDVRIGARPFTALSRLGWARALLALGRAPDQAHELVATAAAEFRRLDMPGPLATSLAVTVAIESARRSASPLSVREREIAELVADALSNREIAHRLVLSERTVETHVRSVLAKLGFNTRTEIATWMVRGR